METPYFNSFVSLVADGSALRRAIQGWIRAENSRAVHDHWGIGQSALPNLRCFGRLLRFIHWLRLGLGRSLSLRRPPLAHSLRCRRSLCRCELAALFLRWLRRFRSDAWRCSNQGVLRRSSTAFHWPLKNLDSFVQPVSLGNQ